MATQAAIRLAGQITDLADMPYHLARPILVKVNNPQQLRDIEVNCPHIAERSEELWRAFIARDISDWENKLVYPKNKNSWHKVYRYMLRQEEKLKDEAEEALRKTMLGENVKKARREVLVVNKALPHPWAEERAPIMIDGVSKADLPNHGDRNKKPTLKNAKTGSDIMAALRRQTAQASKAVNMARPFNSPANPQRFDTAKQQIQRAPAAMLSSASRPKQVVPRELMPHQKRMLEDMNKARATAKGSSVAPPLGRLRDLKHYEQNRHKVEAATHKAREENEARLRAIVESQQRPSTPNTRDRAEFDFKASPIITDAAKRSSPPSSTAPGPPPKCNPNGVTSKANSATRLADDDSKLKSAADAKPSCGNGVPVAAVKANKRKVDDLDFWTPPPTVVRKRPAPHSIFMNNKKRKV